MVSRTSRTDSRDEALDDGGDGAPVVGAVFEELISLPIFSHAIGIVHSWVPKPFEHAHVMRF
jgi:hypothetical protein